MNRYPLWKYAVMLTALAFGLLYALPNIFGTFPAIQISSAQASATGSLNALDASTLQMVEAALAREHLSAQNIRLHQTAHHASGAASAANIIVRMQDTDAQLRAKEVLLKALNPDPNNPAYIVALNLQSASPTWLETLQARPMYLGLDLRGGVHFLLRVDTNAALNKKLDTALADTRASLRDRKIHAIVRRVDNRITVHVNEENIASTAERLLSNQIQDLQWRKMPDGAKGYILTGTMSDITQRAVEDAAVEQNQVTLHNRINELGVAEPIIQRQGVDRIVVELPGVQDTAKAKDIIGRTATLEARLADDSPAGLDPSQPLPADDELFMQGPGSAIRLKKQVIFTGDRIMDASAGFDEQQRPAVKIRLDAVGGRALKSVSREHIGHPMAMILFEKGKAEILTVATIQSELSDSFQITGSRSTQAANDLALLLRAGSLAAPMEIIEERTIGPNLGADNIQKGMASVRYGLLAIALFMGVYYLVFGVISVLALGLNVLLLIAILSLLQATLTLPGIAAIALALGMAIDSNVLINERIREEQRNGAPPQTAIAAGFSHAWATILDSNVTTLIAGLALLALGAGPLRGFAVVHCIGILTSMFSSVFFARGLVNLWYGSRKKLKKVAVG